jgi:hypothetical protein
MRRGSCGTTICIRNYHDKLGFTPVLIVGVKERPMPNARKLKGEQLRDAANATRFDPQSTRGFYESNFLRANHPSRNLAFWIRYTIFSPKGRLEDTQGQLWGIYFNGESSTHVAVKQSFPLSECEFSRTDLGIRIGQATLDGRRLRGSVKQTAQSISWDLTYGGVEAPAFLLPVSLYDRKIPKAKALTGIPLADFSGMLDVNGQAIDVTGWRGSQNHNWGEKHTDMYAWGQVAGFDGHPDVFLECSTARLKIGPLWTPWLTNVVLRIDGRDIALNSLTQAFRNRGAYRFFSWTIEARRGPIRARISIEAPAGAFVGLAYDDPPGGQKWCLNTKLASCTVRLQEAGGPAVVLETSSRAAFEILTTDDTHGVPISA